MCQGYSPVEGGGVQRTDMHCHNCNGNFVAELDYDINGNHEVHCPRCGHIHFRKIVGGKITGDRYDSDSSTTKVDGRSTWMAGVVRKQKAGVVAGAKVSTTAMFIRDLWLNRSDFNGGN